MKTRLTRLTRIIVATILPLALISCGNGDQPEVPASPVGPPNFVIIIADDLGWNDLGAYGSNYAYTPNIDQLASNGVRFNNVFLTNSSCSASRASILSGRYPHSNGLTHLHQSLPADQRLFTHWLKETGYYTAAAGKWHIGRSAKSDFDLVIEKRNDPDTEQWIQALQERPRDQPFFFWLASRDPHRKHDGGEEFGQYYEGKTLRIPQGYIDGPGVREEWQAYYQEVSRFDYDVGRVIHELEQQDVSENTVVIVMSDNGRPFLRGKTWLYDDSIKTPFIVYWPKGMGSAGDYQGLISALDIGPTILEIAGQPIPEEMQGKSFATALADRNKRIRNEVFAVRNWHSYNSHERAVRTTEFLYKENQYPPHGDCLSRAYGSSASTQALRAAHQRGELNGTMSTCFAKQRPAVELFKVTEEGNSWRNLAQEPEYAKVREDLAQRLKMMRDTTGDFDYTPYERPKN